MTSLEATLIKSLETEPSFWQVTLTPTGDVVNARHRSRGVLVQSSYKRWSYSAWSSRLKFSSGFASRWHKLVFAKYDLAAAEEERVAAAATENAIKKAFGV
jgi:hypothetical protein